ncbi:MAG TPA: DUF4097 family beta strand repeat-containing protein [Opitutaceae bacterium]|nr:DUF4097 family beta strand repeat-containing protein [Opitutaceae bacterium]
MKTTQKIALVLALAAAALVARADEETTATVKFSDSSKPGTLRVNIPWADLRVSGGDNATEVVVRSSLARKGQPKESRNGLRRIDDVVSFELLEKDNVVTLEIAGDAGWHGHGAEFDITVPRNTNLVLGNGMGGEINVRGVEGDLDIESMNGEINLEGIASSAVVSTMNGELNAAFKSAPTKPVSLSTMNGEINVRLPANTKANLRMRTHHGSILTDFSEDVLKTKAEVITGTTVGTAPRARSGDRDRDRDDERAERSEAAREAAEAVRIAGEVARTVVEEVRREVELAVQEAEGADMPRAPRAPRAPKPPRVPFGGKSVVGTINGGGVDISLTSMNGTITLRQSK